MKKNAVIVMFLTSMLFTGCPSFLWPEKDEPEPICICCGYDCIKDCDCGCRKCLNYKEKEGEK